MKRQHQRIKRPGPSGSRRRNWLVALCLAQCVDTVFSADVCPVASNTGSDQAIGFSINLIILLIGVLSILTRLSTWSSFLGIAGCLWYDDVFLGHVWRTDAIGYRLSVHDSDYLVPRCSCVVGGGLSSWQLEGDREPPFGAGHRASQTQVLGDLVDARWSTCSNSDGLWSDHVEYDALRQMDGIGESPYKVRLPYPYSHIVVALSPPDGWRHGRGVPRGARGQIHRTGEPAERQGFPALDSPRSRRGGTADGVVDYGNNANSHGSIVGSAVSGSWLSVLGMTGYLWGGLINIVGNDPHVTSAAGIPRCRIFISARIVGGSRRRAARYTGFLADSYILVT